MTPVMTPLAGQSMTPLAESRLPAAEQWTPLTLGARLGPWFDPDDAANRTILSSEYTDLADKSGNGADMTAPVSADRPAHNIADQNGRDTMGFVKAQGNLMKFVDNAAVSALFDGEKEIGLFAVIKMTGATAGSGNFMRGLWSAPAWAFGWVWNVSASNFDTNVFGMGLNTTGISNDGNYHTLGHFSTVVSAGSDTDTVYVDSLSQTSQITGTISAAGAFGSMGIGNNEVDTAPADVNWGEHWYVVQPTPTDAVNGMTYLQSRWATF